jgi:hypothetical protein
MLAALLFAAAAFICAGLALQYAWLFYRALRRRHPQRFGHVSLLGRPECVLALNDADIYASWHLARMNLLGAIFFLVVAEACRRFLAD